MGARSLGRPESLRAEGDSMPKTVRDMLELGQLRRRQGGRGSPGPLPRGSRSLAHGGSDVFPYLEQGDVAFDHVVPHRQRRLEQAGFRRASERVRRWRGCASSRGATWRRFLRASLSKPTSWGFRCWNCLPTRICQRWPTRCSPCSSASTSRSCSFATTCTTRWRSCCSTTPTWRSLSAGWASSSAATCACWTRIWALCAPRRRPARSTAPAAWSTLWTPRTWRSANASCCSITACILSWLASTASATSTCRIIPAIGTHASTWISQWSNPPFCWRPCS